MVSCQHVPKWHFYIDQGVFCPVTSPQYQTSFQLREKVSKLCPEELIFEKSRKCREWCLVHFLASWSSCNFQYIDFDKKDREREPIWSEKKVSKCHPFRRCETVTPLRGGACSLQSFKPLKIPSREHFTKISRPTTSTILWHDDNSTIEDIWKLVVVEGQKRMKCWYLTADFNTVLSNVLPTVKSGQYSATTGEREMLKIPLFLLLPF